MPCDTISTVTIKWSQSTDLNLLAAALRAMGVDAGQIIQSGGTLYWGQGQRFDRLTGEMRLGASVDAARLKQSYSAEVVKSQARKFGWQVKTLPNNQFEITRR